MWSAQFSSAGVSKSLRTSAVISPSYLGLGCTPAVLRRAWILGVIIARSPFFNRAGTKGISGCSLGRRALDGGGGVSVSVSVVMVLYSSSEVSVSQ